ncbi:hypothetical protein JL2886_02959 [Phaeobacter gallaeciensis]|uniref:Uncharacterized protein n=1 Tax=Phaeobacter gallaeciensis TaxID=60890 RepID=A0A1B0ZUJ5_9RHOB|nr:hypothetical protein JL2886_02959 [Phaeobacter gallaeciensis]
MCSPFLFREYAAIPGPDQKFSPSWDEIEAMRSRRKNSGGF